MVLLDKGIAAFISFQVELVGNAVPMDPLGHGSDSWSDTQLATPLLLAVIHSSRSVLLKHSSSRSVYGPSLNYWAWFCMFVVPLWY